MPVETVPSSVTLAKDFLTLQEERVRQYRLLSDAHKTYLASAPDYNLEPYKLCVSDVTKSFKQLSERIIQMRKMFEDEFQDPEMSHLVGKIQGLEETKLKFTVDHQIALQQVRDMPGDELVERNAQGLKKQLDVIIADINDTLEEVRYHVHDLQGDDDSQEEEEEGSR